MYRLICLLCLSFSLFSESVFECAINMPHAKEFASYWNQQGEQAQENEKIIDYSPKEQQGEEALESFTVQTYSLDDEFDIRMMYDKFISTLEENIEPKELLHHKIHHKDRSSIFFEWWVNPPYKDAQREWIKIMKDNKSRLAIIRFQSRHEAQSKQENLWVECVKESSIAD